MFPISGLPIVGAVSILTPRELVTWHASASSADYLRRKGPPLCRHYVTNDGAL